MGNFASIGELQRRGNRQTVGDFFHTVEILPTRQSAYLCFTQFENNRDFESHVGFVEPAVERNPPIANRAQGGPVKYSVS
jgi:hypothetical protein